MGHGLNMVTMLRFVTPPRTLRVWFGAERRNEKTANKLNSSLKKIADFHIHKQIGRKEVLPTWEEINYSNDLNFLLARTIEEAEKK